MRHVPVFDKSKAHTGNFGEGSQSYPPFFQNGLYFNRDGSCADLPHNREVLARRGIDFDKDQSMPGSAPPDEPAKTGSLVKELAKKKPAEVYELAQEIRARLDADNDETDDYMPEAGRKADNIAFIAKHSTV
jgi:hypothetical protein